MDLINQNIRTLRKLENIKSQSQFGSMIGVPSHNVTKYENNVIPKPEVLRKIAEVFDINLHLFMTRELSQSNFAEFRIEHNTEAKLGQLTDESSSEIEIKRDDLDRVATFFHDKIQRLEDNNCNENDRKRLFRDLRSIYLAYHNKLIDFYVMQDHLSSIIGDKKEGQS